MTPWRISNRADPVCRAIADRHYNRQKVGADQFVPPGRCLVLHAQNPNGSALWVTSWPFAEYVKHEWAGAWLCSIFRNEGAGRASDLILSAVAATIDYFGEPPALGMVTFIDRAKVRPTIVRGQRQWGRTYELAGFRHVGETKSGLLAFQLKAEAMPAPAAALGSQGAFL